MVRSPSPLGRLAVVVLPLLALNLSGCLGLEKITLPSLKSTPAPATHVEVIWSKQVQQIPDPTKGGVPSPALVGRMYLYDNDPHGVPIIGDGKIVIDLYDDSPRADGSSSKHCQQMNFPAELLPRLLTRDQLGQGYSIGVPCPPEVSHAHLAVRFEPKAGGPPLVYCGSTFQLDRGMNGVVPANFKQ